MAVLPPLFDQLGVGVFSQTLGDVISYFDQALTRVLQLLALRQTLLRTIQLLECCLHRPHALLTLTNTRYRRVIPVQSPHIHVIQKMRHQLCTKPSLGLPRAAFLGQQNDGFTGVKLQRWLCHLPIAVLIFVAIKIIKFS